MMLSKTVAHILNANPRAQRPNLVSLKNIHAKSSVKRQVLIETLKAIGPAAIAVSGGVDSMTLAYLACRSLAGHEVYHAISPAVPKRATERVRQFAKNHNWMLKIINAGEFKDPRYRSNPLNRCFFCKSNLYRTIATATTLPILSGTNLDDLNDFRPGLEAAQAFNVKHPYVIAGISKTEIRAIARGLNLEKLSKLPAAPCLSSRVETGIRIDERDLKLIDRVENFLTRRFGLINLRCRKRTNGYCIEIDGEVLARIRKSDLTAMISQLKKSIVPQGTLIFVKPYVRGSAFIGRHHHD